MQRLREHPVTTAFDGRVDYPTAVNDVRVDLYNQCCWSDLSDFLQRLWRRSSTAASPSGAAPAIPQAPQPTMPPADPYPSRSDR